MRGVDRFEIYPNVVQVGGYEPGQISQEANFPQREGRSLDAVDHAKRPELLAEFTN